MSATTHAVALRQRPPLSTTLPVRSLPAVSPFFSGGGGWKKAGLSAWSDFHLPPSEEDSPFRASAGRVTILFCFSPRRRSPFMSAPPAPDDRSVEETLRKILEPLDRHLDHVN